MNNRKNTIADLIEALRDLPQDVVVEDAHWTYTYKRCHYEGSLDMREDSDNDSDD